MDALWWTATIFLMLVGLVGTVLPLVPGAVLILGGAVLAHFALHAIGWPTLLGLTLLAILQMALDFVSGAVGAKYFGATKWGAFGAILGALVGLFFGLLGLFLGPVIGVIIGEVIAGKRMIDAGRAGWGSLIGNIGAMLAKLIFALTMIIIFLIAVPSRF